MCWIRGRYAHVRADRWLPARALANGVQVTEGFKCADVDPRGDASYINYISDKATSVGGGVLEALAMLTDVFRG